jgi:transposase-like protein
MKCPICQSEDVVDIFRGNTDKPKHKLKCKHCYKEFDYNTGCSDGACEIKRG